MCRGWREYLRSQNEYRNQCDSVVYAGSFPLCLALYRYDPEVGGKPDFLVFLTIPVLNKS